jgi:hypothetical protein
MNINKEIQILIDRVINAIIICEKCNLIEPSRENINGLEEYENKLIEFIIFYKHKC